MRLKRLASALLAALLLAAPAAARAEERILSYVSDVHVGKDGSLDVTETIRVRSEGTSIQHGIFRSFPISKLNADGRRVKVDFKVVSVARDGALEKWTQETDEELGFKLIRMGDAAVLLPPGEHSYVLRYQTNGSLDRYSRYDELYWNVTGNGWPFPIDLAEARITLPARTPFGDRAAYTGRTGSTARDAEIVTETPGLIVFRTTRPLGRKEGLTIAVAWPKGVIGGSSNRRRGKDPR